MNPLARAIWLLLEAPQTPAMLTATLAPLFPEADPQQVGADIGAFLGTALEEGLLA
ncbi:MAG: PqqD family protein [Gemmobacter sp.]